MKPRRSRWKLWRSRLGVQEFLALDAARRPQNFLLLAVLTICAFTLIVPANVVTTLDDPRFATYLGVGEADFRLDIRAGSAQTEPVAKAVKSDPAVKRSVVLESHRLQVKTPTGEWESLLVEFGDHTVFPLTYRDGGAPTRTDQVALSWTEAKELGLDVGDPVTLRVEGKERKLTLCGIYQDITNGGKTAKATFSVPGESLWSVVYVGLAEGQQVDATVDRYSKSFPGVKVTDINDYAGQTLGATTSQMRLLATAAVVLGCGLAFLATTLFAVLVVARERGQIATLKAVGASDGDIRRQYLVRFGALAVLGLVLGTILASTAGEAIFKVAMGSLGAPGVAFLPNPWLAWLALPLLVALVVAGAALLALRHIDSITMMDQE